MKPISPKQSHVRAMTLLGLLLALVAPTQAIQSVDMLPPDTSNTVSEGMAILSDGSVYGRSGATAGVFGNVNAPFKGTFWGAPGPFFQIIDLGTPVGLFQIDMNDSYDAVGEASEPTFPFNVKGFVTDDSLTTPVTTTLGPANNLDHSRAVSINNNNVVVGTSYTFNSFSAEILHTGTVWRKSNSYIPEVTNIVNRPQSISENGNLVGWEGSNTGAVTKIGNVMGNSIPHTGDIGGLNGTGPTFGMDINDNAQVAGWAFDQATTSGVTTAFLWDPASGMSAVNHAALGAIESFGRAVNSHGLMVGSLNMAPGSGTGDYHAFCYYQGQAVDLNTLIDQTSGWELWHAYDVNDDGWIAGVGTYNGVFRGFRMQHVIIPEPIGLQLVGVALVGMLGTRRSNSN